MIILYDFGTFSNTNGLYDAIYYTFSIFRAKKALHQNYL